jgi:hypothetical protein
LFLRAFYFYPVKCRATAIPLSGIISQSELFFIIL